MTQFSDYPHCPLVSPVRSFQLWPSVRARMSDLCTSLSRRLCVVVYINRCCTSLRRRLSNSIGVRFLPLGAHCLKSARYSPPLTERPITQEPRLELCQSKEPPRIVGISLRPLLPIQGQLSFYGTSFSTLAKLLPHYKRF